MTLDVSSLVELAARVVTVHKIPVERGDVPDSLFDYLKTSHRCVNPKCQGVYFNSHIEHVKFVDFCGKYKLPLLQYLCSSGCSEDRPAVALNLDNQRAEEQSTKLKKKVLLG